MEIRSIISMVISPRRHFRNKAIITTAHDQTGRIQSLARLESKGLVKNNALKNLIFDTLKDFSEINKITKRLNDVKSERDKVKNDFETLSPQDLYVEYGFGHPLSNLNKKVGEFEEELEKEKQTNRINQEMASKLLGDTNPLIFDTTLSMIAKDFPAYTVEERCADKGYWGPEPPAKELIYYKLIKKK